MPTVYIYAVAASTPNESDKDVEGKYFARVDDDVPQELIPSAALDTFHSTQSVDCLDDFEFLVFDPITGVQIFEDTGEHPDYEDYDLSDSADIEFIEADIPQEIRALTIQSSATPGGQ